MEDYNGSNDNLNEEFEDEEFELSHTDTLVGIFTEPGAMFGKTAKFKPKTADWIMPLILVIIASSVSLLVLMSNPQIKYQLMEKQIENLQKQAKEGKITQEMADQQEERIREFSEGSLGSIFGIVGIVFGSFIIFFIIAGVFFLASKFILKGDGSYSAAMVAYGLPHYVVVIQVIVTVIAALLMGKFLEGVSIASLLQMDTKTFAGMLASKLDIFSIWFYALFSIGLAKMFKSESTGKYFGLVFGMWIGFSIIWFFISKAIPFMG